MPPACPRPETQHGLQAAHLAAQAGSDDATVLAALLHDIGHLVAAPGAEQMANVGVKGHENIGADYLRRLGTRPSGPSARPSPRPFP